MKTLKNYTVRFSTKGGGKAAANKKFKRENFTCAKELANHVFTNETKNLWNAYTFSIEVPTGEVFHYSANYGQILF